MTKTNRTQFRAHALAGVRLPQVLAYFCEGADTPLAEMARRVALCMHSNRIKAATLEAMSRLTEQEILTTLEVAAQRGVNTATLPGYLGLYLGPYVAPVATTTLCAFSPRLGARRLDLDDSPPVLSGVAALKGLAALAEIRFGSISPTSSADIAGHVLALDMLGRLSGVAQRGVGALTLQRALGMCAQLAIYKLEREGVATVLERGYGKRAAQAAPAYGHSHVSQSPGMAPGLALAG